MLPLLTALLTIGCGRVEHASTPLTHEVYVWQRAWTPALLESLSTATPLVQAFRVLAVDIDRRGRVAHARVDHAAIQATHRLVVPVVRIDGQVLNLREDLIVTLVRSVQRDWSLAGTRVDVLEIDFDCGTARLGEYAALLSRLRSALDPGTALSITALPDWLRSPKLVSVLDQVDGAVLQVHAVENPTRGLFEAQRALRWIESFSSVSTKPFFVALPAYRTRVGWDRSGRIVSVQSESFVHARGTYRAELAASPTDLAHFVAVLAGSRIPGLQGVVWFRLPTDRDQMAWSLATWTTVVRGLPLRAELDTELSPPDESGSRNVLVLNKGSLDASLPHAISIVGNCAQADGLQGYRVTRDGDAVRLQLESPPMVLRAGRQAVAGWIRCADTEVEIHVTS